MSDAAQDNPGSTLTDQGRVVGACDRFEADWRAGRAPRIDEYVAAVPEPERDALRSELLALEAELNRQGGSWFNTTWQEDTPVEVESSSAETTTAAPAPVEGPH